MITSRMIHFGVTVVEDYEPDSTIQWTTDDPSADILSTEGLPKIGVE